MRDGKRLIAVADDEKEIRDILSLLLTGDGYAVLTAEDGQAVVELASPEIDLYILDVNMPRLSGIMAAAEIRKQYDTPIVFLTAYSSESDKVMGFSVGADDYIVKPFSNVELLMRVKAILRRNTGKPADHSGCGSGSGQPNGRQERRSRRPDLYRVQDSGVACWPQEENLFSGEYLPEYLGRQCCGRQCHHGAHQEYPQKAGGQFQKSHVHQNRLGKGLLH